MQVKISGSNGKGIKKLFKQISKGGFVDVGILAKTGQHEDSDLTVAQIGFWNEFGTVTIPERSFIRATIKDKAKEIQAISEKEFKKVISGKTTTKNGLGILGAFTAGLIQERFTKNNWQPNTSRTQLRKRSSKPLIDTGQLRQSISYEVKV